MNNIKFKCKICDDKSSRPGYIEERTGICESCLSRFMDDIKNFYPEAYKSTLHAVKSAREK